MEKILISHRGNINGKNTELENSPDYILRAIELGYDVEIDVRVNNGVIYLGHDESEYEISLEWLEKQGQRLWIHCKNIPAVEFFTMTPNNLNYFWHQEDKVTLTSKGYVWVYPGNQPIKNSIAVLPEWLNDNVDECLGICSDIIEKYR
jgi:hypothetical protein